MNYKRIYDQIISNAKNLSDQRELEKKQKLNYFEKHHIIPKCMDGDNSKENLVLLTAKEHFICHRLLCEIYPDNEKLPFALWCMVNGKNKNNREICKFSSREYSRIRIECGNVTSKQFKGRVFTDIHRKNISIANSGKNNYMYGKHHTVERKTQISTAMKLLGTRPHHLLPKSAESNRKRSATQKGRPMHPHAKLAILKSKIGSKNEIITCPHCNKSGGASGMKHWHFDNCKRKLI